MDNSLSDQLEEGEIIDEDDLEAISDASISESGKCVKNLGSSRVLHINSKKSDCQRKWKRKKNRKRSRSDTSDSSGTINYDDLKMQLKEAIRIENTPSHKNDLQIRLKGMGRSIVGAQTDDSELEMLRMEALKTAVLNKLQKRKKKKELEDRQTLVENKADSNKENEILKSGDVDEDEDLLRASLLAELANKIANLPKSIPINNKSSLSVPAPNEVFEVPKKQNIFNTETGHQQSANVIKQALTKNVLMDRKSLLLKKPILMPQPRVKPLIINVNDSESDDDAAHVVKVQNKAMPDWNTISSSVEKFLKEQRAKFELETKFNKSALNLLPKSQQIEYQQLLQKLKLKKAQRCQMKNNHNSHHINPDIKDNNQMKVVEVAVLNKQDNARIKGGMANDLLLLRKLLKDIKLRKSGSLQIKTEYQVLASIIKKITVTNSDRKKHEARIKSLNAELTEVNKLLAASHDNFSTLVKELVSEKEKIDQRIEAQHSVMKDIPLQTSELGNTVNNSLLDKRVYVANVSGNNNECEDMDVCHSDEDTFQIDIVDPNDIDQIYMKKITAPSNIPKYVSPLNPSAGLVTNVDPLGVMCPYEVNGLCRDVECKFIHYSKECKKR